MSTGTELKCPACGGTDLMDIGGESICMGDCCPWNSCERSVNRGDLDHILKFDWSSLDSKTLSSNLESHKGKEVVHAESVSAVAEVSQSA